MTEVEWMQCQEPAPLLTYLQWRGSDRKLRLFAAACCRRMQYLLPRQGGKIIEVAERRADGLAGQAEVEAAAASLPDPPPSPIIGGFGPVRQTAIRKALLAILVRPVGAAQIAAQVAAAVCSVREREEEPRIQCIFLRDLFGNPFRSGALDRSWLTWKEGTISKLAQAIYQEGAFDRLPIVADALEEAGCTDAAILDHCRGPGPHIRGCWVVDLILGKE
jgi:hypothetical protein